MILALWTVVDLSVGQRHAFLEEVGDDEMMLRTKMSDVREDGTVGDDFVGSHGVGGDYLCSDK